MSFSNLLNVQRVVRPAWILISCSTKTGLNPIQATKPFKNKSYSCNDLTASTATGRYKLKSPMP